MLEKLRYVAKAFGIGASKDELHALFCLSFEAGPSDALDVDDGVSALQLAEQLPAELGAFFGSKLT
jgi:hypothetical protein